MTHRVLDLQNLAKQCALTPSVREALAEAARVMLAKYRHPQPCEGSWEQTGPPVPIQISWELPDATMIETHGNLKDATEDGACALAISAMHALGFEVRGRTPHGSGADYWMIQRDGDPNQIFHLEVSGIGGAGAPAARLENKVAQGRRGPLRRPGIALVFRFEDANLHAEAWSCP